MKRFALTLAVASLLAAGLLSNVRATPPEGPVTIMLITDFSNWPVVVEEFEVLEGADILGCSWGTSVGSNAAQNRPDNAPAVHNAVLMSNIYCEREPDEYGPDFVIKYRPNLTVPGPGDANGHWVIWKATREFSNLRGEGEVSVSIEFPVVVGILTGTVHRDPPEP